jgi:AcrR family transcriptional regulator
MRQITGEAGVNLAAVNYHFGSKEALIQEVFRRRLDWLNDERMRVLNAMEAEADGKPLKPSQIVDGFFGTLLRMADDERRGGITFLRLLGRMLTDPRNSSAPFSPMNTARSLIATSAVQGAARRAEGRDRLALSFHARRHLLRHCRYRRLARGNRLADRGSRCDRSPRPPGAAPDVLPARRPARPLPQFSDAEAVGK